MLVSHQAISEESPRQQLLDPGKISLLFPELVEDKQKEVSRFTLHVLYDVHAGMYVLELRSHC